MNKSNAAYGMMVVLGRGLVALRYDLRLQGLENVPARGPVILAANHVSHWDPLVLCRLGLMRDRMVRPVALESLFRHALLGPALRCGGAIPVRRGTQQGGGIDAAATALRDGACILIYPEGTIAAPEAVLPARPGIGHIMRATRAPVVPVTSWGLHRGWGTSWRRRARTPAGVVFGPPLPVEQPGASARDLAESVLERIRAQVPEARRLAR